MTTLDLDGLLAFYNGSPDAERPPWQQKLQWEPPQKFVVASDGSDYQRYLQRKPTYTAERKRPYWERTAWEAAANVHIERVRLVTRPVTDYTRYEVEWGYLPNLDPFDRGKDQETVLILDSGEVELPDLAPHTDRPWHALQAWDGTWTIIVMIYDDDYQFDRAVVHDDPQFVSGFLSVYDQLAATAEDVRGWWARHPELRRDGGIPLMAA